MFRKVAELEVGKFDAVNYDTLHGKKFLKRVFYRDGYLDQLLDLDRYFLVGEKGTGKTAYATFLSNEEYKETASSLKNISTTDYEKFNALKSEGHLPISSLKDCWKVILLMLVSEHIKDSERSGFIFTNKFKNIREAIDDYYDSAFDPEVVTALEFVQDAELNSRLISKIAGIEAKEKTSEKTSRSKFQTSLASIDRAFRDALGSLKLSKDHILFIDGIDVRPSDVTFEEYIEVIKALSVAIWDLNKDFFGKIRDSRGRIKVVLLVRPDIFDAVEFHNSNAKIRDNSVVLSWKTTYTDFKGSRLFALIDGLLGKQVGHDNLALGEAWSHYFPYDLPNMRIAEKVDDPFVSFLRYSFYRPRDIVSYLDIMQKYVAQHRPNAESFNDDDFKNCQQEYSDYLLGEVKDYLAFYYSTADFDRVLEFFKLLDGRGRFSWDVFESAYSRFSKSLAGKNITLNAITGGPGEFLQFLYSMNVVGYDEKAQFGTGNFVHWYFRDRTTVKLDPQIPSGLPGAPYTIHPGLLRALKLGGGGTRE